MRSAGVVRGRRGGSAARGPVRVGRVVNARVAEIAHGAARAAIIRIRLRICARRVAQILSGRTRSAIAGVVSPAARIAAAARGPGVRPGTCPAFLPATAAIPIVPTGARAASPRARATAAAARGAARTSGPRAAAGAAPSRARGTTHRKTPLLLLVPPVVPTQCPPHAAPRLAPEQGTAQVQAGGPPPSARQVLPPVHVNVSPLSEYGTQVSPPEQSEFEKQTA
jgi:hypothetical protein